MSPAPLLQVDDVVVDYSRRRGSPAVDHVSLDIPRGRTLGLVGQSGCGKSSLARVIAGLAVPAEGAVRLGGAVLPTPRGRADATRIQMVFQDPGSALNPMHTVRRTLTELLLVHRKASDRRAATDRAVELLDLVGLGAAVLDARPRGLSGGQRQRVGIARALAVEPEVLIADEAVSALDVSVQAAVLNTLRDLGTRLGLTMLFISHDLAVTRYVSDELAVMHRGRIVERGLPDDVLRTPRHEYTRSLVAATPRMDGPALTAAEEGRPL
ncbi:ABC transporter ATP-binding protein [Herbidospora cretacea]|uniref:ABC transporter ATP-binding protein n=1 Tax=Herbidospora cretacea TaxID=28444 RepID=UPI0004C2C572|nr:ATP-binding cassette domain-containing protein [Herbidospora cretacea]